MKSSRHRKSDGKRFGKPKFSPTRLRIVSGDFRGSKIAYNGDPATRPMKERTRESVFSLLGGKLHGQWIVDLFGGTGVLALEAISRGAPRALVLELAKPAVSTIIENLNALGIADQVQVKNLDTLRWLRDFDRQHDSWPSLPWVVFVCPPYRMWGQETGILTEGIRRMYEASPSGSRFVCETDGSFDIENAIPEIDWDVRRYTPATIAIGSKDE